MSSIFDRSDETPEQKARHDARYNVTNLVERLAVAGFGATRNDVPVEGYRALTDTQFDPATAAIQAARLVQGIAKNLVYEYAMDARGAGVPWAEIGTALGAASDDDPGVTIYRYLVWDQPMPDERSDWARRERKAVWKCRSCGQRVTDTGPWESNPVNMEEGHAAGCARHASEIQVYDDEWAD